MNLTVSGADADADAECASGSNCPSGGAIEEPTVMNPQGAALFLFAATTPASGLQPAKTLDYVEAVDIATGMATAPVPAPGLPGGGVTVEYAQNDILTASIEVANQANNSESTQLYDVDVSSGAVTAHAIAPSGFSASFAGSYIVTNPSPCKTTVINEGTLATAASINACGNQNPIDSLAGGSGETVLTSPLTDGYFTVSYDPADLEGPPQPPIQTFSLSTGSRVPISLTTSGPRSTLALSWSAADSTNSSLDATGGLTTYSVGSWTKGFSIGSTQAGALNLNVYAVSDNDIWLTNTDQSVIIDGTNGKTVASAWAYVPEFGANGWTVVEPKEQPTVGQAPEYLVHGSGPLASLLNQVTLPAH